MPASAHSNDVDYGLFLNELRAKVEPVLVAERGCDPQRAGAAKDGQHLSDAELANACARAGRPGHRRWELVPSTPDWFRWSTRPSEMLNGLALNFVDRSVDDRQRYDRGLPRSGRRFDPAGPSVFPMLIVFGMMGWLGVDNRRRHDHDSDRGPWRFGRRVVHFLIWYRRGLSEGKAAANR